MASCSEAAIPLPAEPCRSVKDACDKPGSAANPRCDSLPLVLYGSQMME
jgi:hypothetical protein